MLAQATLTAFVATADPARATAFYRNTLGLRLVSDDQFAVVFDCGGVQLRIQKVETLQPHPFTTLGWGVASIRRSVAALAKRGVTFERYPFLEQDELGIWPAPSGAKVAWFKDPDGNLLSLTESGRPKARGPAAERNGSAATWGGFVMAVAPIPEGYHTVTPYLFVEGADRLLAFVKHAFGAEELLRIPRSDGSVMHAEVRIGDSRVMIGDPTGPAAQFGAMPTSIYLYVPDCDTVYRQALAAGGRSVQEVRDIPFNGERYGGVQDPTGNIWWIATHVKDVSLEESERLMRQIQP